jgi:hypothetical protein
VKLLKSSGENANNLLPKLFNEAEKTNIPDKWNMTYTLSLPYTRRQCEMIFQIIGV